MRGRAHGVETRAKVLAAFLTGETVSGAAKAGGVSRATAREWWRAFRRTDDFREIAVSVLGRLRPVAEQFATKKENDGPDATPGVRFDIAALRDERYGYRGE
jgi:transposase-like protein